MTAQSKKPIHVIQLASGTCPKSGMFTGTCRQCGTRSPLCVNFDLYLPALDPTELDRRLERLSAEQARGRFTVQARLVYCYACAGRTLAALDGNADPQHVVEMLSRAALVDNTRISAASHISRPVGERVGWATTLVLTHGNKTPTEMRERVLSETRKSGWPQPEGFRVTA